MSESEVSSEKARRWSPFVCPDCRVLFRVPRDHEGDGIICPSCRRMLRMPRDGDLVEALMATAQGEDFPEGEGPKAKKKKRSKRKRKRKQADTPDWDASAGKWKTTRSTKRVSKSKIVALVTLAFVSTALLYVVMNPKNSLTEEAPEGERNVFNGSDILPGDASLSSFGNEGDEEIILPGALEVNDAVLFERAENAARQFLSAGTTEEILSLVRQTDDIGEKVLAYYRENEIEKLEISKFDSSGGATVAGQFVAVDFLTSDFEKRQMAFVQSGDEMKVDWESWVGWSEMSWDELLEDRPKRPVIVRAMLTWVDYYNFSFSDESLWRSFRLTSANGESVIYGYVRRNSKLDQELRPREKGVAVPVTLAVSFPNNESTSPQVLIGALIANGWVLPDS